MRLGRSTLYGWLDQLRPLFAALIVMAEGYFAATPTFIKDGLDFRKQAQGLVLQGHNPGERGRSVRGIPAFGWRA